MDIFRFARDESSSSVSLPTMPVVLRCMLIPPVTGMQSAVSAMTQATGTIQSTAREKEFRGRRKSGKTQERRKKASSSYCKVERCRISFLNRKGRIKSSHRITKIQAVSKSYYCHSMLTRTMIWIEIVIWFAGNRQHSFKFLIGKVVLVASAVFADAHG